MRGLRIAAWVLILFGIAFTGTAEAATVPPGYAFHRGVAWHFKTYENSIVLAKKHGLEAVCVARTESGDIYLIRERYNISQYDPETELKNRTLLVGACGQPIEIAGVTLGEGEFAIRIKGVFKKSKKTIDAALTAKTGAPDKKKPATPATKKDVPGKATRAEEETDAGTKDGTSTAQKPETPKTHPLTGYRTRKDLAIKLAELDGNKTVAQVLRDIGNGAAMRAAHARDQSRAADYLRQTEMLDAFCGLFGSSMMQMAWDVEMGSIFTTLVYTKENPLTLETTKNLSATDNIFQFKGMLVVLLTFKVATIEERMSLEWINANPRRKEIELLMTFMNKITLFNSKGEQFEVPAGSKLGFLSGNRFKLIETYPSDSKAGIVIAEELQRRHLPTAAPKKKPDKSTSQISIGAPAVRFRIPKGWRKVSGESVATDFFSDDVREHVDPYLKEKKTHCCFMQKNSTNGFKPSLCIVAGNDFIIDAPGGGVWKAGTIAMAGDNCAMLAWLLAATDKKGIPLPPQGMGIERHSLLGAEHVVVTRRHKNLVLMGLGCTNRWRGVAVTFGFAVAPDDEKMATLALESIIKDIDDAEKAIEEHK